MSNMRQRWPDSGVRSMYYVTRTKLHLNGFPNYSCDPPDPPDPAPYPRTENTLSNNTGFFGRLTMVYIWHIIA